MRQKKSTEARAWLKRNKNKHGFASNRFGETANARSAVQRLYAAGAKKVLVSGIRDEARRIEHEGGPYADTLLVVLPRGAKRDQVMMVADDLEPDESGFDRGRLRLWWD